MKIKLKRYLTMITACLFSLFVQCGYATKIDKIIVFGDSLSDNGNIYSLTLAAHKAIPVIPIIPKDPPYYQGRFSNGPVWVDDLADAMKIPLLNYAYGGSWAEPLKDSKLNVPFGLGMQVSFYLVSSVIDFHRGDHLFVIWSGANDYVKGRSDPDYATTNTVATIQDQIDWLIYYGAKNFLVLNIPDLGLVPEVMAQGPDFAARVSNIVAMHNRKFADMINKEKESHPDVKIVSTDAIYYFNDIIANPDKYHLTNVREACYSGGYWLKGRLVNSREILAAKKINIDITKVPSFETAYLTSLAAAAGENSCANPNEYLFWDQLHPTSFVHKLISALTLAELNASDVKSIGA